MHSTLKQATLSPPERNPRRQQEAFDRFQHDYNHERPHEALDDRTPASCYQPSPRAMPRRVPDLEYGDDVELRRVSQQGSLKMLGERTFVSEIFAYEWLGLRALDERYFEVLYGPVRLGFLDTSGSTAFIARCTSPRGDGWGWTESGSPWKCRPEESLEIQRQDFHPSHRPWKSLRDFHIPTGSTIPFIITPGTQNPSPKSVTHVLG